MRQHLGKILLAAVLLALLLVALRPTPVLVDSELVDIGPVVQSIEEEGRTRVVARYLLSAPLAAEVRRINHDPGDRVAAGEVVAVLEALAAPVLDARTIAAAKERVAGAAAALAAVERERQALATGAELAADELQRSRQLAAAGLISPSELAIMVAEAEKSAAWESSAAERVRAARHELAAARTALEYAGDRDPAAGQRIELTSPVDGVVLRRYFESARVVTAGEPIVEIADPAALEVEVDLLSAEAVRLEPGMRVLLERWGADEPLEGMVRRIEPGGFTRISALGVEEQRVLVIVDLLSPREQWQRLGDAYRVNARFILREQREVVRVPAGALFRRPGAGQTLDRTLEAVGQAAEPAMALFVIVNNRARLRPVTVGEAGGRFVPVISGLTAGERVIVHPPRELADGARVRPRQAH